MVLLVATHAVLLGMQHITAPICTGWNSSSASNGFVDDVPPSPRSVIESVCRLFSFGLRCEEEILLLAEEHRQRLDRCRSFLLEGKLS